MKQEHVNVDFFQPESVGERDWGEEILVALSPGKYSGKVLKMKAGHVGGLQFHHMKDESAYIVSGELRFYFDKGDGKLDSRILKAGDCVRIPPGAIHREEAITDVVIFETSTPHFNDRCRVEERYGEPTNEGGLPSTTSEEVETK